MPLEKWYSPKQLARETGMCISQCRTLIEQSPDKMDVSRDPNSRKKRYVISESGFRKAVQERQRKAQAEQLEREGTKNAEPAMQKKPRKTQRRLNTPGMTPEGKIMNSRQLKEAGLWKGA